MPRAALWMMGALFSFLFMAISGREIAAELSLFELVFFRNLVCLVILVVLLAHFGFGHVRTAIAGRHVVRNTLHFFAQFAWFFGVASIPLAEVFAIEFTTPIWTALLAAIFLGERFGWARACAIALGFLGVLVILRPGIEIVHPAAFAVLAAALGYAITFVITKKMVATEHPLTILFWMNLVQLPIGLIPSMFMWVNPPYTLWPWIVLIGICGLSSHYCLSRAFTYADVSLVAPLDFLRLPLAAVAAWFLYLEPLDPFVFLGATLVFAGNWMNLRNA